MLYEFNICQVGLLERSLEQEQRRGEGLTLELDLARRMVVQLEVEQERLEGAFLSLQRKYQEKADRLERLEGPRTREPSRDRSNTRTN